MGMVRRTVRDDEPLTEKMLAELEALKDRPIDYSDDPKRTPEQIRRGRLLAQQIREKQRQKLLKKQMFSLRLQKSTISWWKALGDGYTSIMARLLDEATRNPEWISKCL